MKANGPKLISIIEPYPIIQEMHLPSYLICQTRAYYGFTGPL